MIRWLREHWEIVLIASMLLAIVALSVIDPFSPPPPPTGLRVLMLPTIEHGTEAGRWWLVRWVDTEYREASCFSEEEVESVMAFLRGGNR